MRPIPIAELNVPELAYFSQLTDVKLRRVTEPEQGIYLAEGNKVMARSLAAGHQPLAVLTEEKWLDDIKTMYSSYPDLPVYVGQTRVIEELTGYNVHRGSLAAVKRPTEPQPETLLRDSRRVIILEDIVDHTNVGAIFRSVAGLGADAVFITPRCADPLYRRSVRVSMGTVLQIPWTRFPDWEQGQRLLHEQGFHIAALALSETAETLDRFAQHNHDRIAFVVGTEGDGLSHQALEAADTVVTIPMRAEIDSLNVAAASAVALWELRVRK
ncbi:RNA methyltransferase [Lysinibacter sp. HNR]|uniref:TrmH family RNA methyltransferase n=1 Tax=Lysinibacter sp. HNR TaxID=3031408 RepID=UPI0024352153|nr:RNA methyltransferase [Lysinibacter sp. HNR]WGD36207.1 RNA methyltransferase [Lysinibacter sp. HNR]